MKIQYGSDLHLENPDNRAYLKAHPILPQGDILILAGDTSTLNSQFYQDEFFTTLSQAFQMVFLVPGNHEFYSASDTYLLNTPLRQQIRENVWLVNNLHWPYGGIHFLLTTLWSYIPPASAALLEQSHPDFIYIKYGGLRFSANYQNQLHQTSVQFLESHLHLAGPKVITTHYLPSPSCNVSEFTDSPLNAAFCTNLEPLIEESQAEYWIFGHSHRNKPGFQIGKTTLLTNQLGTAYPSQSPDFSPKALFEV